MHTHYRPLGNRKKITKINARTNALPSSPTGRQAYANIATIQLIGQKKMIEMIVEKKENSKKRIKF